MSFALIKRRPRTLNLLDPERAAGHAPGILGGGIKALSTLLVDFDIDPSKFFIMYNKTRHKTANWQ